MDLLSQMISDRRREAAGRLAPLLASGPALELDAWALRPAALELVLGEVAAGRRRVVECGSGASTVLIARLLCERGHGCVRALEHDPAWAAETRRRLAAEHLDAHAEVIEAPLRADPVAAAGCRWYEREALAALPAAGIELLLIDGPPASPERGLERSRYPALPLLGDRLAAGAVVLLDDADRAGERWVLERWRRELGLRLERHDGFAVGRVAASPRPGS